MYHHLVWWTGLNSHLTNSPVMIQASSLTQIKIFYPKTNKYISTRYGIIILQIKGMVGPTFQQWPPGPSFSSHVAPPPRAHIPRPSPSTHASHLPPRGQLVASVDACGPSDADRIFPLRSTARETRLVTCAVVIKLRLIRSSIFFCEDEE